MSTKWRSSTGSLKCAAENVLQRPRASFPAVRAHARCERAAAAQSPDELVGEMIGGSGAMAVQFEAQPHTSGLDDRPDFVFRTGLQDRASGAQVFPQLARNEPLDTVVASRPGGQQTAVGREQIRRHVAGGDDT